MRARKIDQNQTEIVEALRQVGATVQILSAVGQGCPDICAGIFHRNYFMEIKNPDQPKSAQALTAEEAIWHNEWKGQVAIVRSPEEAIAALTK
jgi:hypothetical protein